MNKEIEIDVAEYEDVEFEVTVEEAELFKEFYDERK